MYMSYNQGVNKGSPFRSLPLPRKVPFAQFIYPADDLHTVLRRPTPKASSCHSQQLLPEHPHVPALSFSGDVGVKVQTQVHKSTIPLLLFLELCRVSSIRPAVQLLDFFL